MNANYLPTPSHAEAAFYSCFSSCDASAMASLWGPGEIVCIHPGGPVLIGHEQVMQSWQNILIEGGSVTLRSEMLSEFNNDSIAVHVVREVLSSERGDAMVLATNVYRRFSEGWKIVEHHASQPVLERMPIAPEVPEGATLQ